MALLERFMVHILYWIYIYIHIYICVYIYTTYPVGMETGFGLWPQYTVHLVLNDEGSITQNSGLLGERVLCVSKMPCYICCSVDPAQEIIVGGNKQENGLLLALRLMLSVVFYARLFD